VSVGSVNAADAANKKWSAFLARNAQYINRQSKTSPGERILLQNPVINALCRRRVQPVIHLVTGQTHERHHDDPRS
jgi:hypothetical protein